MSDPLEELRRRLARNDDEARPRAVERRRKTNQRTARENIKDLVDENSFSEYGGLAVAAQRQRHSLEELIDNSPADGIITGIGSIAGVRTLVVSYDYTVFAGTQGFMGHKKLDRVLAIARTQRLLVVLFAEGGGGRPNDTDMPLVAGLDTTSFLAFAALSGLAPRVGIVSGRCFAGNAALLGCCDVIIATENSTIGMGGPAMIEGSSTRCRTSGCSRAFSTVMFWRDNGLGPVPISAFRRPQNGWSPKNAAITVGFPARKPAANVPMPP